MLVIMSEINCLDALNAKGVYPDKFYTSFDAFKDAVIHFRDCTLIIILAGSCRFNKHLMLDIINNIYKRYESENDVGITDLLVFSDTVLPSLDHFYYKFTGNFEMVDQYRRKFKVRDNLWIWDKLQGEPKKSECYLSRFDRNDTKHIEEAFEKRFRGDDAYIDLIKVPKIQASL